MAYQIVVAPLARKDILATGDYLQEKVDRERAKRWEKELLGAIGSLSEMPQRCPLADESRELGVELRELHHKPHRILFTVDEPGQSVQILRVYHSARAPLRLEDLD